jgi:hypothetical protein
MEEVKVMNELRSNMVQRTTTLNGKEAPPLKIRMISVIRKGDGAQYVDG